MEKIEKKCDVNLMPKKKPGKPELEKQKRTASDPYQYTSPKMLNQQILLDQFANSWFNVCSYLHNISLGIPSRWHIRSRRRTDDDRVCAPIAMHQQYTQQCRHSHRASHSVLELLEDRMTCVV